MTNVWKFRTSTAIADPGNGNVRFNASDLTQATALAIAHKPQGSGDASVPIAGLVAGDLFTMHRSADDAVWVNYVVAAPAVQQTDWSEVAIAYRASQDPVFVDAEPVVFVASFGDTDTPGGRILATLDEAKAHIQITDPARDAEVLRFLEIASAMVYDYVGSRADPAWNEVTAPDVVRAATLRTVVYNWEHRGDDSDDGALWSILRELLMRRRDPAIA